MSEKPNASHLAGLILARDQLPLGVIAASEAEALIAQAKRAERDEDAQEPAPFELKPGDIKIDVYQLGARGGWDVRQATAVRITHLPTGIAVEKSEGRSQHANKAKAWAELEAILQARETIAQRDALLEQLSANADRNHATMQALARERDTLQAELAAMREQKPVGWCEQPPSELSYTHIVALWREGHQLANTPLYAAPVSAPSQVAAEVVQVPRELAERIAKPVLFASQQDAHADDCAELRALLATSQGEA